MELEKQVGRMNGAGHRAATFFDRLLSTPCGDIHRSAVRMSAMQSNRENRTDVRAARRYFLTGFWDGLTATRHIIVPDLPRIRRSMIPSDARGRQMVVKSINKAFSDMTCRD